MLPYGPPASEYRPCSALGSRCNWVRDRLDRLFAMLVTSRAPLTPEPSKLKLNSRLRHSAMNGLRHHYVM